MPDGQRASSLRVRAPMPGCWRENPVTHKDVLRLVDRKDLAPPDESRLDLVLADLALRNKRLDEAELLLKNALPGLPSSSRNRYGQPYARVNKQILSLAHGISRGRKIQQKHEIL